MESLSNKKLEQLPRSKFVDYLAKISILLGAYLVFDGVLNLRFLSSIKERPEYLIAEQYMPSAIMSPAETIFEIIMQMIGIAASAAMLRRLNWGRVAYMVALSVLTLSGIISSVRIYLSMSEYMDMLGLGSSLSILIVTYVISLGINVYIVWKLSTEEIRREFLPDQRHLESAADG